MTSMLRAAYLANFVAGTYLSVIRDIPARPFGLETRRGVRQDVIIGIGCGLAPPWPLISLLARPGCARSRALWCVFLVGALSEPITRRALTGHASRLEALIVWGNLALPATAILTRDRRGRVVTVP